MMNRRVVMKSLLGAGATGAAFLSARLASAGPTAPAYADVRNPRSFGAQGDGRANDTRAIQNAIDETSKTGGGIVYVSPGAYLIGTIVLKSHVTVYLEAGAALLGSPDLADYYMPREAADLVNNPNARHLIFAFRAVNIGLAGPGLVDGQSAKFIGKLNKPKPKPEDLWRMTSAFEWERKNRVSPMVEIAESVNVRVEDVTLQNAVGWTLRTIGCNSVVIRGVKVRNPDYAPNSDGIDPSSSENVMISDCDVDTGDDALCIKSDNPYGPNKITRNVTVTNCILSSACNGFKIGSEGPNGFANIVFSNSVIYSKEGKSDDQRVISAIDILMPDGGWIEGITISNITIRNARVPIFIRLQNIVGRPEAKMVSWLKSVMIADVQAFGAVVTSSIMGIPGHPVEDVTIRNVRIQTDEKGQEQWASNIVPEREHGYPEGVQFGRFPSFGFYCRHVERLQLSDIDVRSSTSDPRPMIHCDDVSGLELRGIGGTPPAAGAEMVLLRNVRDAAIHGNYARPATGTFVRVEGKSSREISLFGNDLHRANNPVLVAENTPAGAVLIDGKLIEKKPD
jgi:hypothetical protein